MVEKVRGFRGSKVVLNWGIREKKKHTCQNWSGCWQMKIVRKNMLGSVFSNVWKHGEISWGPI